MTRRWIEAAKDYAASKNTPRDGFEFQMLYGIRRDLQRRLIAEGYPPPPVCAVRQGRGTRITCGGMAERPANVLFILRNLFRE